MRGISLIGLGLGFLLLAIGCSPRVTTSANIEVRDSIVVREVPRLVEVTVPGEKITVTEYIECDTATNKPKPANITGRNGRASVVVTIDDKGKLTADGICDSLLAVAHAMDREIFKLRHEKKVEVRTETKIEYKTRAIDIFCRAVTGCLLLLIVLVVALKHFRIV